MSLVMNTCFHSRKYEIIYTRLNVLFFADNNRGCIGVVIIRNRSSHRAFQVRPCISSMRSFHSRARIQEGDG